MVVGHLDRTGPVVSFLPIILIGVLFGIAMDYEVFPVSGMREEWVRTGMARRSVIDGVLPDLDVEGTRLQKVPEGEPKESARVG
ncbi:hypothetical protein [Streptomyces sp. NPDC087859]|uniref:hypothetical protein n=1 Tax=Streptomyces sp. NPDC087859 TaxID=3365812 RepID=UPI0037FA9279